MAKTKLNINKAPLFIAKKITQIASDYKTYLDKLTPITQKLVRYWFDEDIVRNREINFHQGQKEAILNTIYLVEVLKIKGFKDIFSNLNLSDSLDEFEEYLKDECKNIQDYENLFSNEIIELAKGEFKEYIQNEKDNILYKKFAYKMATGTGKTWVINALIIWQYLNAKAGFSGYSQNFLIIAPGLIVKDRLINSFKKGSSDIEQNSELFLLSEYKSDILYLLDNVKNKEDIKNITNGSIIVENWHTFIPEKYKKLDELQKELQSIRKLTPGTSGGNALDTLDKEKIDYIKELKKLDNLVVINDEAHHIHSEDIIWNEAIENLRVNFKNESFYQFDFTATPYKESGKKKVYFNHIVVDFDLLDALKNGLVKLITLDKVKLGDETEKNNNDKIIESELTSYKAIKIGDELHLSKGQENLITIGVNRLKELQLNLKEKRPKLMITVEDTKLTSQVEKFLKEKLNFEDKNILTIHSNKKGELGEQEYDKLKDKLFNLDDEDDIEIVVSVLMLKEGFDVNNICVVVPLRATESGILLEQTIGRGLRLMYRRDISNAQRAKRYEEIVNQKTDEHSFREDILHIIEHPQFEKFYDDLTQCGVVLEGVGGGGDTLLVESKLQDKYQKYDMFFIRENSIPDFIEYDFDEVEDIVLDIDKIQSYDFSNELEKILSLKDKDINIIQKELTSMISLNSKVDNSIKDNKFDFYDDVLDYIVKEKTIKENNLQSILNKRKIIKQLQDYVDEYICNKMFNKEFDPEENHNYKIFGINYFGLSNFVANVFMTQIKDIIGGFDCEVVEKYNFAQIDNFKVSEENSLAGLTKTIYTRVPFGSGSEKDFMLKIDNDTSIVRFIKILEFKHTFATILYVGDGGMMYNYYPDFMVETKEKIYIVEIKGKHLLNTQTKRKQETASFYTDRINELPSQCRGGKEWKYMLLSDEVIAKCDSFDEMIGYEEVLDE